MHNPKNTILLIRSKFLFSTETQTDPTAKNDKNKVAETPKIQIKASQLSHAQLIKKSLSLIPNVNEFKLANQQASPVISVKKQSPPSTHALQIIPTTIMQIPKILPSIKPQIPAPATTRRIAHIARSTQNQEAIMPYECEQSLASLLIFLTRELLCEVQISVIIKRTTDVNYPYYKHHIISPILIFTSKIESVTFALSSPFPNSIFSFITIQGTKNNIMQIIKFTTIYYILIQVATYVVLYGVFTNFSTIFTIQAIKPVNNTFKENIYRIKCKAI
ncbi:hypothetical protein IMG5_130360 [Ichthyophthirius multifiliis]|uniref:Transmembrane protein n=1 Tax=Ichthyophthirius multifiliis TaxID=5932 RepID=G0QW99_ICHMU|nr:hypothetical protein IMG5_130360 [Ichthyophthirius multifiliis]EGR30522.1 hypothetical protein IMG5_130360 [Ichthyophthirius multifiliis]|eukprot:XP_004032109.1 hypothetical protein IMG5_130360 [Ichthyophthirius multifiliis]